MENIKEIGRAVLFNEPLKVTDVPDIEKVFMLATVFILRISLYLLAFFIINKYGVKLIKKFFNTRKNISERKSQTLESIFINIFRVILVFLLGVSILDLFGFDTTSVVALFSVLSLAVGLAAQGLIKDFIAGFLLVLEDQFSVDDTISINDQVQGIVETLGLRTTSIRTIDGELYIIPNGNIETIRTFSKEFSRAKVIVGVDYSTNIDECIEILKDEMKIAKDEILDILEMPKVQGVVELGDSSVNIRVLADCKIDMKWEVERELLRRIKNRLDKENIVIPFPQRVVHTVKES